MEHSHPSQPPSSGGTPQNSEGNSKTDGMAGHAGMDPRTVSYAAPADARGDQLLEARLENGVKVYDLDVSVINWNILPYQQVMAYAFNRQVPGPRIRLTEATGCALT